MSEYGLVCNNIKRKYARISLELDFSIIKGELVSIIGPSGSGKSQILRLI